MYMSTGVNMHIFIYMCICACMCCTGVFVHLDSRECLCLGPCEQDHENVHGTSVLPRSYGG